MLLTIEKVAILKGVDIFAQTPEHILAGVARIAQEVRLNPGERFIQEGDYGDSMYTIIDGQVRVHRDDRTIVIVTSGESVGELAVLDPEPRAASVTAVSEVFMFRIDKEPFDEVMADRPEIARGVIQALCRRIRQQGRMVPASQTADETRTITGSNPSRQITS